MKCAGHERRPFNPPFVSDGAKVVLIQLISVIIACFIITLDVQANMLQCRVRKGNRTKLCDSQTYLASTVHPARKVHKCEAFSEVRSCFALSYKTIH